jgi:heavy metal sensor kinase
MIFSIRTKLTFWYVLLLTVSLLVFAGGFYYALSRVYMDRIDTEIHKVAGMTAHAIVRPPGQLIVPPNFDILLERFFGIRTRDLYIQILDSEGNIVAKSATLEGFDLNISSSGLKLALRGDVNYETVKTEGVHPIRVVSAPVVVKGKGLVGIVQVGDSLAVVVELFHYMIYIFGIGLVASVLFASCVGWFLARKALAPVDEINRMARRITAENLDERINIEGPEDEMGRLASTLNEMIAGLERSFGQIRQFTSDASHELKTPLTIMKGEIEIALRGELTMEEANEVLLSTLEEIDRMSSIVAKLLTLARADDEGEAGLVPVRIDLVLADSFRLLKKVAAKKGISIEIIGSEALVINADELRLSQVMANLIDNAIKYTSPGGSVEVLLAASYDTAIFRVTDTGVGIADDDLAHLFDRFYRVDKARSREMGGAGLGLSICHDIVESFGGVIEVDSEPDKGSVFTVRLPIFLGDAEAGAKS